MKRTALFGAILAALAPGLSFADMNYSNIEVSMVDIELGSGPFDVDGDGFEFAGSFEITDKVFLFGEWQDQSLDFGIDGRKLEAGAGLTHAFSDKLDFVGTLSLVDSEVELNGQSADDDGLALGAGVRGRVSDQVELEGGLKHVDYDESGGDTGFTFGGRYYFNQSMALGASAEFADEADTLRLGFRWEF